MSLSLPKLATKSMGQVISTLIQLQKISSNRRTQRNHSDQSEDVAIFQCLFNLNFKGILLGITGYYTRISHYSITLHSIYITPDAPAHHTIHAPCPIICVPLDNKYTCSLNFKMISQDDRRKVLQVWD